MIVTADCLHTVLSSRACRCFSLLNPPTPFTVHAQDDQDAGPERGPSNRRASVLVAAMAAVTPSKMAVGIRAVRIRALPHESRSGEQP